MDKYLRPCLAELVGTFMLCFLGAGSILTSTVQEMHAGSGTGLLAIAVAYGLAMAIAVTIAMNVSGGHVNPATTISLWFYKRIDGDKAIAYVIAQLLGGVIAGGLLVLIFQGESGPLVQARFGAPHISHDFIKEGMPAYQTYAWGVAIETILTFVLVFAFFGTVVDPRAPKVGGFAVGLAITAGTLVAGPLTGAAMNPARAFGLAIWEAAIMGWDRMWDHGIYWAGPIIGGILAAGLYANFILPSAGEQGQK